jgi:hypothetical protein
MGPPFLPRPRPAHAFLSSLVLAPLSPTLALRLAVLSIILAHLQTLLLASSQPNIRRPQEIQNGRCAPLVSKQLRHGGVPCRSLSARCLLHPTPHGGLQLFPTVAVLEEVLPGLRRPGSRLVRAPPASVICGLPDLSQVGSDRCLVHSELVELGSDSLLSVGGSWIHTLSIPEEVVALPTTPLLYPAHVLAPFPLRDASRDVSECRISAVRGTEICKFTRNNGTKVMFKAHLVNGNGIEASEHPRRLLKHPLGMSDIKVKEDRSHRSRSDNYTSLGSAHGTLTFPKLAPGDAMFSIQCPITAGAGIC